MRFGSKLGERFETNTVLWTFHTIAYSQLRRKLLMTVRHNYILTVSHIMRRGQRTFQPDDEEDRHHGNTSGDTDVLKLLDFVL